MSVTQHNTRESPGVHVTAAADCRDDTLGYDQGFAGLRIKQVQPGIDVARADRDEIVAGEKYFMWDSGEVDVVIPGGLAPAKGDTLYIATADNTISKVAGAGKVKLGKVRYVGPERGLESTLMTVSFDARKDF